MDKLFYFDNNATTRISRETSRAMASTSYYCYGNPSSLYSLGQEAKNVLETSRKNIKNALFRDLDGDVIFTSGATEGNNSAIFSALELCPERRTILTTAIEHPSVMNPILWCSEKKGYRVVKINVTEKGINTDEIGQYLNGDIALVSVMTVNNETGTILPVKKLFDRIKTYDNSIICHSDCVQAVGKITLPSNADYLVVSAHKFHGPRGVGCILKAKGTEFCPHQFGGGQENGYRSGTENVAGIRGMEVAALETVKESSEWSRIIYLQQDLETFLKTEMDCYIVGEQGERVPGVTNVGFRDIDGNHLELLLNTKGILVSTGSACSSGKAGISHVIQTMRIPDDYARTIRISMSRYTTVEEVEYLKESLKYCVTNLKGRKG